MPYHHPTSQGKAGKSSLISTDSFFMLLVDHIIDNTCEVCKNDPSSCLPLLVEHLSSTPHYTGPPNATHPGYGALRCSTKRCDLSHLKLSVFLGVSHSDFYSHFFSFYRLTPKPLAQPADLSRRQPRRQLLTPQLDFPQR